MFSCVLHKHVHEVITNLQSQTMTPKPWTYIDSLSTREESMGKPNPMRFSISSLLILVTLVALSIWFMQVPSRTATQLAVAIENVDQDEIRRLCTKNCADRIIQELKQHPFETLYTQKHLETIRDSIPKYKPDPQCTVFSPDWRQIIGRSRQLKVILEGKNTVIVNILGANARSVEEEHLVFSFTYPVLR